MKNKLFTVFTILTVFFATSFLGCQKDIEIVDQTELAFTKTTPSAPAASTSAVIPRIIPGANNGGNRTCAEVGTAFGTTFDLSIGQFNFANGVFDGTWPAGLNVVVTNGTHVSFSMDEPIKIGDECYVVGAVIVKGGPNANVYYYAGGTMADQGLASPPVGRNGNIAGLSNLTFCFIKVSCEPAGECGQGETAWAGNFAGQGAAWWFYYDTQGPVRQSIFAGQQLVAGAYVEVVNGVMTIVLGNNMRLQTVNESVKVQGYNTLPSSRPASGQFTTYKGSNLVIPLSTPLTRFYAIHLDVEVKVDCPE